PRRSEPQATATRPPELRDPDLDEARPFMDDKKRSISGDGGLARGGALEYEPAVLGVDPHDVALAEVAFEQPERQRVLHEPLDRSLEGPRTVRRIPAGLG